MELFRSGDLLYTAYGVRLLEAEQCALLAERHRTATSIHDVLVTGGGNVEEYKADTTALREQQARVERRLTGVQHILASLTAVEQPDRPSEVSIGSEVVLQPLPDGQRVLYAIVGEGEGDPKQGLISYRSAVAAAVLGHEVGATVSVPETGAAYRILGVRSLTLADLQARRPPPT